MATDQEIFESAFAAPKPKKTPKAASKPSPKDAEIFADAFQSAKAPAPAHVTTKRITTTNGTPVGTPVVTVKNPFAPKPNPLAKPAHTLFPFAGRETPAEALGGMVEKAKAQKGKPNPVTSPTAYGTELNRRAAEAKARGVAPGEVGTIAERVGPEGARLLAKRTTSPETIGPGVGTAPPLLDRVAMTMRNLAETGRADEAGGNPLFALQRTMPATDPVSVSRNAYVRGIESMRSSLATATGDAEGLVNAVTRQQQFPPSAAGERFGETGMAGGARDFLTALAELNIESSAAQIPSQLAMLATLPLGGVGGVATRAVLGGSQSALMEVNGVIIEEMTRAGYDVTNVTDVRTAFADKSLMQRARVKGLKKGLPVGAFDALSIAVAGQGVAGAAGRGALPVITAGAKELATQAALGMGGELAGQAAIGEYNLPSIVGEGLGELLPGAGEIAMGALGRLDSPRPNLSAPPAPTAPQGPVAPAVPTSPRVQLPRLDAATPVATPVTTKSTPPAEAFVPGRVKVTGEAKAIAQQPTEPAAPWRVGTPVWHVSIRNPDGSVVSRKPAVIMEEYAPDQTTNGDALYRVRFSDGNEGTASAADFMDYGVKADRWMELAVEDEAIAQQPVVGEPPVPPVVPPVDTTVDATLDNKYPEQATAQDIELLQRHPELAQEIASTPVEQYVQEQGHTGTDARLRDVHRVATEMAATDTTTPPVPPVTVQDVPASDKYFYQARQGEFTEVDNAIPVAGVPELEGIDVFVRPIPPEEGRKRPRYEVIEAQTGLSISSDKRGYRTTKEAIASAVDNVVRRGGASALIEKYIAPTVKRGMVTPRYAVADTPATPPTVPVAPDVAPAPTVTPAEQPPVTADAEPLTLESQLDAIADAALDRFTKRRGRLQAGIDPADLADVAIWGAAKIAKTGLQFARWSKLMVEKFGDDIRPHLRDVWKRARDLYQGAVRDHAEGVRVRLGDDTAQAKPKEDGKLRDTAGGQFNLAQFADADDALPFILSAWEERAADIRAARKVDVLTDDALNAEARALLESDGFGPVDVERIIKSGVVNTTELRALQMVEGALGADVQRLADEYTKAEGAFARGETAESALEEARGEYYRVAELAQRVLIALRAATTSAGRTLRATGMPASAVRGTFTQSSRKVLGTDAQARKAAESPDATPTYKQRAFTALAKIFDTQGIPAGLLEQFRALPDNDEWAVYTWLNDVARKYGKSNEHPIHRYHIANLMSGPRGSLLDVTSTGMWHTLNELVNRPLAILSQSIMRPQNGRARRTSAELKYARAGFAHGMRVGVLEAAKVLEAGVDENSMRLLDIQSREFAGGKYNPFNLVLRVRGAANTVQYSSAYFSELFAEASRRAYGEGLRGTLLDARVQELVREAAMGASTVAGEMDAVATEYAEYITFTARAKPGSVLALMQGFQRLIVLETKHGTFKPMKFLMPLVTTYGNLIKVGTESSPLGFLKLIPKEMRGTAEGERILINATIGTLAWLLLPMMVDDDDLVGAPPLDPRQRDAFYESGKLPHSVRVGKKYVSYQGSALQIPLDLLAALIAKPNYGQTKPAAMMSMLLRSAIDYAGLMSTRELMMVMNDPTRAERFLGNLVSGFIPLVSMQRNIAQVIDPKIRTTERDGRRDFESVFPAAAQVAGTAIPGVSKLMPPRVNALGREVERTGATGALALSPIRVATAAKAGSLEAEINRLSIPLGSTSKTAKVDAGKPVPLTTREWNDLQRFIGQKIREVLTDRMATTKETDADKRRAWPRIMDDVKANARKEWVGAHIDVLRARAAKREAAARNK